MSNMCLSVNKAIEDCCESNNNFLGARLNTKATAAAVQENKELKNDDVDGSNEDIFISDNLALTTQYTRKFFKFCSTRARKLKSSTFYKIMTRTTQPAHLASIILVLFISYNLWPEYYQDEQQMPYEGIVSSGKSKSPLTSFIYLSSFAAHFGTQIWMTFVSGLALYFSLPRHTFGMCQEVLFPKYFLINTILSTMTLITFAKMHNNFNDLRWIIQLMALSICLLIEMVILLYLTPSLLKLMRAKYQFEQKLGNGDEIGYQRTLPSTIECPEYKEVHKKFRKVHFKCAMGNVVTICCTFMHLYYLASKISIL